VALPSKDDWPGLIAALDKIADAAQDSPLVAAVDRLSDAVDRLTFLVEEVAARGLDLPTRDG
jgi:hypothetical protein